MKKSESVRLGIIGVGSMGRNHARKVATGGVPGLELTALADADQTRFAEFPKAKQFSDAGELIVSGEVDAVLIATPHYSHTSLGIAALEAGLHVLVEKPISVHKKDCERLLAAHDPAKGQVFAAMFNQRTDPRYRKLKDLIDGGDLGRVQRIDWVVTDWFRTNAYYRLGGWRATWEKEGGGVLLNQCPHNLDLWQWLFGMPSTVYARCRLGCHHPIEVEDSVTAMLEYEDGAYGVFVTTTGEAPGVNRLEVAGDRGHVAVMPDGLVFRRNDRPASEFCRSAVDPFEKLPFMEMKFPTEGRGEQQTGILKNFVNAIVGKEELIAPAVEGIRSVELANAMVLSSFRGQTIHLPMDAEEYAAELEQKIDESRLRNERGTAVECS